MRTNLAAIVAAVLASAGAPDAVAQQDQQMTARDFVTLSEERQRTETERLMNANTRLVDECASGRSAGELAAAYGDWIAAHPDAADQPAYLGFTRMLTQACAKR